MLPITPKPRLASRTRSGARLATLSLTICLCLGQAAPSGEELLAAARDGDTAAVRRLVQAGAPVNAVDAFGSSALMHAALCGDLAAVGLLLDHGADPNLADKAGATALLWAIPDAAKVRLLLERGARVNAVSAATGRTPLLVAAGRPGAADLVRLLLEKGADPRARDKRGENAIFRAASSGDAKVLRLLIRRGGDINAANSEQVTALLEAGVQGNRVIAEMLVARGARLNARDEGGFTVLTSATSYSDFSIFRRLMAQGADPRIRATTGVDLMMAAAASDTSHPEVIRELVKLGLDATVKAPNLHTQHGFAKEAESPLDWASRHGDTPVARLLSELTGEQPRGEPSDRRARLRAATPEAAIEKALPLLYDGGGQFFDRSGCASCHHNVLPALAFSLAQAKGIPVDRAKVRRNYLQSIAWIQGGQEGCLQDVALPGGDTTAAYLLWGLEADGHRRDRATDALVHLLAPAQTTEGGWRVRADRPPIESGRVTPTALSIRALRAYAIPGRRAEFDSRIRLAAKWLWGYPARTGEEKAMRLLGLAWAGADGRWSGEAASQLAAAQRADGGWAQLDTLASDSYATGQALYALHAAGHLSSEALQKGARFLLDTQLAGGSWHVRSRSYPVQSRYFDTGFPHGRDQWISAAGTSWACIGLSLAITRPV